LGSKIFINYTRYTYERNISKTIFEIRNITGEPIDDVDIDPQPESLPPPTPHQQQETKPVQWSKKVYIKNIHVI
jgi:hypothetical protein